MFELKTEMQAITNKTLFFPFSQALGTAINSTKVMTAQQVVKTDDGGEVRTAILYVTPVRSLAMLTLNCCL